MSDITNRLREIAVEVRAHDLVLVRAADELERLRAENARLLGDHAAALRLVADVRAAIGDDGKRMQPELLEYCRKLLLFARIRFGYAPGDYMHVCSGCAASFIANKRAAVCQKCADAAIDAAMGGGNG